MKLADRDHPISRGELTEMSAAMFGDLVKAVVDVRREVVAVDAEMHSDEEAILLERGSSQEDPWGINLYPALQGGDFVEFDSVINLRPSRGNRTRGVEDGAVRQRILAIVERIVAR
jgi:Protein of unknown function (DUF5674)